MSATAILGVIADPLVRILNRRSERKQAKTALKAKAELQKSGQDHETTLTDAEWEVLSMSQQGTTWKDEYALIIGTMPYLMVFLSAIWYAFTGDYRMMEGTLSGINALDAIGVDVGFIITAVVLAASGLSVWRKFSLG